jgi:arginine:pyruvate transaminase
MRYAAMTKRLAELGSRKWAIHLRGREMREAGIPVIELTIGEPDVPVDPSLVETAHKAMLAGRTRYSNGRGEPGLLDALAAKYSRRTGRTVTRDNFVCFPGTQTALYAVMTALVEPGDKVLVPDPYYATYEGVVRAPGAELVPVPTRAEERFHLNPRDLEAAIVPGARVLLLNTPHNPSGAVLSRAEIEAIGEVCRRHDLWIVSDEVYEELAFAAPFASPFDDEILAERTIAVSSISKSHAAPGFRSGWAAGSEEFCRQLLPVAETMLFGNPPFIADATAHALRNDPGTAALMRAHYAERAALITARLGTVEGLRPIPPEAGMFVLVDVSGTGLDGQEFAARLLEEQHVSVMPGTSFGAAARYFVRMSLTVPQERLAEACERIDAFVRGLGKDGERLAS